MTDPMLESAICLSYPKRLILRLVNSTYSIAVDDWATLPWKAKDEILS
jgi:hypothetical protein